MSHKIRGFTLLEILVVVGILIIILLVGSNMFFSIFRGSTKARVIQTVKQNGDYALSVMERMIRNSLDLQPPCTSGMSSITIKNPDKQITTFDLSGNQIASNAGNYITSSEVKINRSRTNQFDCTPGNGSPDIVVIQFSLSQAQTAVRPEEQVTMDFKTTVITRNY